MSSSFIATLMSIYSNKFQHKKSFNEAAVVRRKEFNAVADL